MPTWVSPAAASGSACDWLGLAVAPLLYSQRLRTTAGCSSPDAMLRKGCEHAMQKFVRSKQSLLQLRDRPATNVGQGQSACMLGLQLMQGSKAGAICQTMPMGRAGNKRGVAQQTMCKGFGKTVQFCQVGNPLSVFQEGIAEATSTVIVIERHSKGHAPVGH